jgi:uncharacterized protein with GYD domain|tara:strand:- start:41 stop:373 length:333 start_codon:yes stop_codon:yes gene_type:complete
MAFYMFTASYTTDAIKVMVNHPQDREAAGRAAIEALGGKMHHFFFTFGEPDIVAIIEIDDDVAMVACSMLVGASGALAHGATTKLMTSADAMAAMVRAKDAQDSYSPPSG